MGCWVGIGLRHPNKPVQDDTVSLCTHSLNSLEPVMLTLLKSLPRPTVGDRIELHSCTPGPRGTTRISTIHVEAGDTAADVAHFVDYLTALQLGENPGTVRFVSADRSVSFDAFSWSV
jgi:hypothetical protein